MIVESYPALTDLQGVNPGAGSPGKVAALVGMSTPGDCIQTLYIWTPGSSTAPDSATAPNTPNVVQPTSGSGRWLKNWMIMRSDWNQADTGAYDYIANKPTFPSTTRTTSTQSLSLVGTGATGTQISATKDSSVRFYVSTSTTSTIGGPATSVVTLKKCATNSATEGDWTTVGVLESDQTVTLAVVLQSLQVVKGMVATDLPAGWYVKLVNSGTGTHSEQFISGEKTIYG